MGINLTIKMISLVWLHRTQDSPNMSHLAIQPKLRNF